MDTLTSIHNYANLTNTDVKTVLVNAYTYVNKVLCSNLHYGLGQMLKIILMCKNLHTSLHATKYMLAKMQPYVNLANVNKALHMISEHLRSVSSFS